jgi:hypothetical protein
VLDVFRFAWFAIRTFLGLIALVLALYGALWLFVKVDSALRGDADPDAALRRVNLYNTQPPAPGRSSWAYAPRNDTVDKRHDPDGRASQQPLGVHSTSARQDPHSAWRYSAGSLSTGSCTQSQSFSSPCTRVQ